MRARVSSWAPIDPRVVTGAALLNGIALLALATGHLRLALVSALLPIIVVVLGVILVADGTVFILAALGLELTVPPLNDPLPFGGGTAIFPADLLVGLALASWAVERLLAIRQRPDRLSLPPRTLPALGLPFFLFAIAIGWAALRGHHDYGASLLSRPVRMILYAAIAVAIVRANPKKLYKGIVALFYGGAVWQLLNALYYAATGGSQSIAPNLSTGGTRLLSISVSLYLAGTLFLGLINLSLEGSARAKLLHASMVILSAAEIVLAYSRGTFIAVVLLGMILVVFLRDIRIGALSALPLAIPILVLAVLTLARTDSMVIPTFVKRISPSISQDPSVQWRHRANDALWEQARESPLNGVGFGRDLRFVVNNVEVDTPQEAHNDFLYLLAGSGIFGLGSFLLLYGRAVGDALVRFRSSTTQEERALVLFSVVTVTSFVLNGLVEPLLTLPSILLTIWTLFLLPASVRPSEVAAAEREARLDALPAA